ncbi:hypothetical protein Nocox_06970 [Nonomuraea coxensis DSM 45129]|uniref:Uncharacterized protein n=1 Tax=Nonomuraea coxensis DSM 45129 TaxID=1122611 RepID=A0ABX8TU87_9ACTN|nr:hypothetical protein [Nonomuraea coxensis]QYC39021.1 hypothetical protein Nocox_06970 [Nonomuraea coxensis DSM 45129]
MLKEACAVSALVAAALVPSMPSQAQSGNVPAAASSETQAPKCKWLEEDGKRCHYCRGKKGSGYKRQYCERRREPMGPMELECVTTKEPTATSPNRSCKTCTDAKTGKRVSRQCDS